MTRPLIGITMGDPAGVGPELCIRAATDPEILSICRPVIFGNSWVLADVCRATETKVSLTSLPHVEAMVGDGYDLGSIVPTTDSVYIFQADSVDSTVVEAMQPGEINADTGKLSFDCVEYAIDTAIAGHIAGVVTCPIHKEAWHQAGIKYPGHTEVFAQKTSTDEFCMLMTSPLISCALVTCHVGLADVMHELTTERILRVIRLLNDSLTKTLNQPPRLIALGLNPHAGENGLFGNREEQTIIQPAIDQARSLGIHVDGPVPPDTAFVPAKLDEYDGHVCMYHDQGLIPFKALALDTGVNTTLGLPIIRTSVCLLYTSPSPRDATLSRMPSSA